MIENYIKLTFKILARRKVFTLVTMAGIIIPVTLIVLISSLFMLFDGYQSPGSKFENILYLDQIQMKEIKSDGSVNMDVNNSPTFPFVKKYIKTLQTPEKVAAISDKENPEMIFMGNNTYDLDIRYTDDVFWQITDFNFIEGRPFNTNEYEASAKIIIIDKKTSNALFGATNSVGKTVEIKNLSYSVIGVVENTDITQYRFYANAYIPFTCSDEFSSDVLWSGFCHPFILMKNKNDFDKVNNEFQQKLKQINFSELHPMNNVEAQMTDDSYLEKITTFAGIDNEKFTIMVALLIFFFIIFPSINLANINNNRIYERLSESGVRKTFGATVKTLILQFIIENILVVLIGGLLSFLLAWFIILTINQMDLIAGIHLRINIKVLIISLLAIFLIGILSGIIPAVRMSKSQIVNSLNSVL